MPTEPIRESNDRDWAPCPGCDQPIILDDRGFFMLHLGWLDYPDVVVECDWSQKPCLDA